MINNKRFELFEKEMLEFFLQFDLPQKNILIEQFNSTDVKRDYTPFYMSINFKLSVAQTTNILHQYPFISTLQVLHDNGTAPTVFNLIVRNGLINEFEIFNADSSCIVLENLMDGVACLEFI